MFSILLLLGVHHRRRLHVGDAHRHPGRRRSGAEDRRRRPDPQDPRQRREGLRDRRARCLRGAVALKLEEQRGAL